MRQHPASKPVYPNQVESEETPTSDVELNERTRTLFREKIRNGELEDRKIDIQIKGSGSNVGMIGAGMMDEASMINLQEMLGGMMPKKNKRRKVTVAEARRILLEEEAAKLIDMDEVKEEAIRKAEDAGIIFIDEIDKIASCSNKGGSGPDVSRKECNAIYYPLLREVQ